MTHRLTPRAQYDANDNLVALELSSGLDLSWTIRADGQPVSRIDWLGLPTGFEYDALGNAMAAVRGSGPAQRRTEFGRDSAGILSSLTDGEGNTQLFESDAMGRLTAMAWPDARRVEFEYDASGRLVEVRENGSIAFTYRYDANNNRVDGGVMLDAQDRLFSWQGLDSTYSADGERIGKADGVMTTQYSYDAQGTMVGASLPDGRELEYLLDGQGRRAGKRVDGQFVHGWLYTNAIKPVARLDSDGQTEQWYVYATTSQAPAYMESAGGQRYRIISDHLGSVRLVIDSFTGAVVQRIDYDPWGGISMDTNPGFQPFAYTGGLYDPDTGLQNFGQREYDASTARWMTRDPIGFDGGQFNLYEYSASDPINRTDRNGLESDDPTVSGTTANVVSGLHAPSDTSELAGAVGALSDIAGSDIGGMKFTESLVLGAGALRGTHAGKMANKMLERFGNEVGINANTAEVLEFLQRNGNQEKLNAINHKLEDSSLASCR